MNPLASLVGAPDLSLLPTETGVWIGAVLALMAEAVLLVGWRRWVIRLLPDVDNLTASALGLVAAHAALVFLLNLVMHILPLGPTSFLAWGGILLTGLGSFAGKIPAGPSATAQDDHGWPLALVCTVSAFVILVSCGVDFGKVHLGLIEGIRTCNLLPGQDGFPVYKGYGYHYGVDLFAASAMAVFHVPAWLAEDLLPLSCHWTLFAAFRWIALLWLPKAQASRIALLAYFGVNLRLFYIAFMAAVCLFSGAGTRDPHAWDHLRILTRDFNLSPSSILCHVEVLLLPSSQLGLPLFFFSLGLLLSYPERERRSRLALCLLLLCAQPLFREDLFGFSMLGAAVVVLAAKQGRIGLPLLAIPLGCALLLGGVLTEAFQAFLSAIQPLEGTVSSANLYSGGGTSWIPSLGTLSIRNAQVKVPIHHPQLLLDLILDYGPAILGCTCLLVLLRRLDPCGRWMLLAPLPVMVCGAFFVDHPSWGYKLDLQRVLNYNLCVLLLFTAAVHRWPSLLATRSVLLFAASGILATLALPGQFKDEAWGWADRESFRLGTLIRTDATNQGLDMRKIVVLGLNPGYTGCRSYAYEQDNLTRADPDRASMMAAYRADNPSVLLNLGVTYLVVPSDRRLRPDPSLVLMDDQGARRLFRLCPAGDHAP